MLPSPEAVPSPPAPGLPEPRLVRTWAALTLVTRAQLFHGHTELILQFNTFLPTGYKVAHAPAPPAARETQATSLPCGARPSA